MKKSNLENYNYENRVLSFKSYIKEFTTDLYEEFNYKSEQIGLLSKINDLFDEKKVNFTEDQAAWHPKYREASSKKEVEKYYKLLSSAKNVVTIGIGGSFEGPKLLIESMGSTVSNYLFITGSDPHEFEEKIKRLKRTETIFIVASKSFTTDETIEMLKKAFAWSQGKSNFIAITANKDEANKYNIDNIIEIDKEIGGRYSIWSDISLAAYFENHPHLKEEFLQGGSQADRDLKRDDNYFKFIKTLSFSDIWLNNYKNKNCRVVLSYIWKLRSFPNYVQQLEMESLGKIASSISEFKKTGQIIFGGYGPTAQHSYFQLLHQGTQEICGDIIVSSNDKNCMAFAQGITQAKLLSSGSSDLLNKEEKINGNIPLNLFLLKNVDPFTIGYLIASWEHRTFITASMLDINPFDQFGVNAGKIYTKKYLLDID
jgi:glucose-6-phosphate isomerase